MSAIARIEGSSDYLFRMIVENPGAEFIPPMRGRASHHLVVNILRIFLSGKCQ